MEDESRVFLDASALLQRTIPQKSDNDVDSEDEIIKLGVKFLARSFYSALIDERESLRSSFLRRQISAKKIREAETRNPAGASQRKQTFHTPTDRRVYVNGQNYLKTLMKQQVSQTKPSLLDSIFKSRAHRPARQTCDNTRASVFNAAEVKGLKKTTDTRADSFVSGRKESLVTKVDGPMNSLASLFAQQKTLATHN